MIGTRKATLPTLFTLGQVVLLQDDLLRACPDGVGEVVVQGSHEFFQSPGRPSPFLVASLARLGFASAVLLKDNAAGKWLESSEVRDKATTYLTCQPDENAFGRHDRSEIEQRKDCLIECP